MGERGTEKLRIVGRKVMLGVLFDTVTIDVICSGGYEAQVLYDDLVDRLQSGEGLTLTIALTDSRKEG